MASILSGVVHEVGEGFIVLGAGNRIIVSSRVWVDGLVQGARVVVKVRPQGAEWVAEDIEVENGGG